MLVLALSWLLGACAADAGGAGGSPAGGSPAGGSTAGGTTAGGTTAGGTATGGPTPVRTLPPTPPSDRITPAKLRGTLDRSSPACTVLVTGAGQRFVLLGVDEAVPDGAEVDVVALLAPNVMVPCEGPAFRVRSLREV